MYIMLHIFAYMHNHILYIYIYIYIYDGIIYIAYDLYFTYDLSYIFAA